LSYVDMRSYQVQFYTDHPAIPGSEPEQVVVLILNAGDPEQDNIVEQIEELAFESRTSYFLEDKRGYANWGASGGTQEIIIQLMSDPGVRDVAENLGWQVAKGAAFGAGTLFLQGLVARIRELRQRDMGQEGQSKETSEHEPSKPTSLSAEDQWPALYWLSTWAQTFTANAYGVDSNELDIQRSELTDEGARVTLLHKASGRRFSVKVDESGSIMYIRPLAPF
jgi:hypothetical protein